MPAQSARSEIAPTTDCRCTPRDENDLFEPFGFGLLVSVVIVVLSVHLVRAQDLFVTDWKAAPVSSTHSGRHPRRWITGDKRRI